MIDEDKGVYPVGLWCRVMRVSESPEHAFASGQSHVLRTAQAELATQVKEVFDAPRRRYGSRRIVAELKAQHLSGGRVQARSLMRRQKLQAIAPRRFRPQTTDSRPTVTLSPNLLREVENRARQPREVMVGDIT